MKKYIKRMGERKRGDRGGAKAESVVEGHEKSWSLLGLSWADCGLIGDPEELGRRVKVEEIDSIHGLFGYEVDLVAALSPDVEDLFIQSADQLFKLVQNSETALTILIPRKEPPIQNIRYDGTASAFFCTASVFRNFINARSIVDFDTLCFDMLNAILNGEVEVQRLMVKQLPIREPVADSSPLSSSTALIMAHRGNNIYLEVALSFIERAAASSGVNVRVGLDVDDLDEYKTVFQSFRDINFYHVNQAPVGPYVVRQHLIDRSSEEILVFQDSDDISCYDRFVIQNDEMRRTKADLIGCHYLQVDEINRCVDIFRYPLDVSGALRAQNSASQNYQAKEPILHPTVMATREGFVTAGGFSTDQKIANDTQFMLRAYFSLRMKNVDHFLYIKRRHPKCLTVSAETALGNPLRRRLGSMWAADFEAVKSGKIRLESTSLAPRRGTGKFAITSLSRFSVKDI